MSAGWKKRLEEEFARLEREQEWQGYKKKKALPEAALALRAGDVRYFVPGRVTTAGYGQRVTVLTPPTPGAANPTARVRFPDATERRVQVRQLRAALPSTDPPFLVDARSRPAWKRLVRACREAQQAERPDPEGPDPEDTDAARTLPQQQDAEARARQLAGMVAPLGSDKAARTDIARVLLEAAHSEARAEEQRKPGRGGQGQPRAEVLPPPTHMLSVADLDQERRALINNVAKCIHRRYFLSDRELAALSEQEREQQGVRRVLGQIIGLGERQVGVSSAVSKKGGRPSALHAELEEQLTAAYQKGLEVARLLTAGRVALATSRAQEVQEHRLRAMAAQAGLERDRKKHHTGRFFHGDVLSVRELPGDGTMIQHYTRLTIIYAADGHTVTVANAAELESLTGLKVGPGGWGALCRWIEDQSERMNGRKQGRRQDDDEHLIYRNDRGSLVLRSGLAEGLVLALECVAQSLMRSDVQAEEIPAGHPAVGIHGVVLSAF